MISRKVFFKQSVAFVGATLLGVRGASANAIEKPFNLKFAPRLTMDLWQTSASRGLCEKTKYFYEQGFRAVEGAVFFTHLRQSQKQIEEQIAVGELVAKLGMEMGNISSMNEKNYPIMTANYSPSQKLYDKSAVQDFLSWQLEVTFRILRRLRSKTFIIGAGTFTKDLPFELQYKNVVENMTFCAKRCQEEGGIMEIEPLSEKPWQAPAKVPQCLVEEHRVLLNAVKNAKPLNMLRDIVDSTLMAIAGRESAYSGISFKYDWIKHKSQQRFAPTEWKFGKHKLDPIPCPGFYKLS